MADDNRTEVFLVNYSRHEARIFAYILSLVPRWSDAEDVFQETTLALWRSFDDFQEGTDFFPWAAKVALNRVLTYRKQSRKGAVQFSEEFLQSVENSIASHSVELEARLGTLSDCVEKLSDDHREIIAIRYGSSMSVKELAEKLGRSVHTLYKTLERIRHLLVECIDRADVREKRK